jgi:hypothetical protein
VVGDRIEAVVVRSILYGAGEYGCWLQVDVTRRRRYRADKCQWQAGEYLTTPSVTYLRILPGVLYNDDDDDRPPKQQRCESRYTQQMVRTMDSESLASQAYVLLSRSPFVLSPMLKSTLALTQAVLLSVVGHIACNPATPATLQRRQLRHPIM